jgi:hypothetical protein
VGGRAGRPKSYRHKIFGRTKKVVTGQSQITHFSCFKSILAYPRFTQARKMLRIVAYEASNYATMFGCHWVYYRDEWPPLVAMVFYYYYFSNFEPNIFG